MFGRKKPVIIRGLTHKELHSLLVRLDRIDAGKGTFFYLSGAPLFEISAKASFSLEDPIRYSISLSFGQWEKLRHVLSDDELIEYLTAPIEEA